jgi:hypothetical protein
MPRCLRILEWDSSTIQSLRNRPLPVSSDHYDHTEIHDGASTEELKFEP